MSPRTDASTRHREDGELFSRPKHGPSCASTWQLSRSMLGLLPAAAQRAVDDHLACCPSCAERRRLLLEEEARTGPLPPSLLARAREHAQRRASRTFRARTRWFAGGVTALTAVAAAAVLVLGGPPLATERLKGAVPIRTAVLRRDADVPVEVDIGHLRVAAGDRLRLGVEAPSESGVLLQGWEDGRWTDYFQGSAGEPWLPVGVDITSEGQTRLRVILCPTREQIAALKRRWGSEPSAAAIDRAGCLERRIEL